ncbi:uncharacterized protein PG998_011545 [Apiospora kogelbergensis]|uniref:uncharacterized protein n=1 Tax=Apiospora kogelbergensis TaxID=1337665 RepID=UPI00312D7F67
MGRTEPSVGQPPAAFRKDVRAKKAKATLNKTIPALLSAHPRSRRGTEAAELIANPPALKTKQDDPTVSASSPPGLVLQAADTLTVARRLLEHPDTGRVDLGNKEARVGILNMASPLSPGGGFLNGAVYTPDVLVFRDDAGDELEKKDRWFVDCVSAGMLRFPDVSVNEATGRGSYALAKDRELVLQKMRSVLRILQAKKVRKVVLGAWGCGAYGNPVGEIAAAWKRVLLGNNSNKQSHGKNKAKGEVWHGIETVTTGWPRPLKRPLGKGLTRDDPEEEAEGELEDDPDAARVREIQEKIEQLELSIQQAKTTQLQDGLRSILSNLNAQLDKEPKRPGRTPVADDDSDSASDGP